jgi:signal transduction histidine kinase
MEGLGQEDLARRRRNLRRVADYGALAALSISAAIFLLWVLHAPAVEAWLPFLFEMKANTALAFGAAGTGLFLLARGRPRAAAGLAVIPILIGLLSIVEYGAGVRLHIDELLIRDWSGERGGFPGRPSPNTAITLAAGGFALVALAMVRPGPVRRIAVTFICFAVIAIAMAALAGYIAESPVAVGWGTARKMSIPSALCGLALGAGMMAYSWQSEIAAIARIPIWIPALLGFGIVLLDISTPLEVNAGICYVPLVFCALWFERPHVVFILAALSTLLIAFGFLASPPGTIEPSIAALNRGLDILAVWGVAILVHLTRATEQKLQRNARHLAYAQQIAAVGSFELDFATMTLSGSDPFNTMIGVAADSDRSWATFASRHIPPDERGAFARIAAAARRGERSRDLDFTFVRGDGEGRNAVLHCELLFGSEGVPAGIIGVVHDVTELRRAEAHGADIEAQLRHAQKLEALGTLAGGIAHDLNNTLVPITTLVPFMLEDSYDPSHRRSLEIVMGAARRAKALVAEILAFSRKDPVEREAIRLDLLARDTLTVLRAGIPASINIVDALEPVPEVIGSKGQIYQTILNLATNAAQAIGDKTGTITVGATCDPLDADSAGGRVRFFVADDGAGMDEATSARIFEPFFSTKDARDGTGLGLAIVNGIVASHGGSISVCSALGKGTRFDLLFPMAELKSAA